MTEGAMSAVLTEIGTFFTESIGWMGDVLDKIVANPVLLILVVAMPICGFAVGLLNRLIKL
jgi:hypothetical protein